MRSHPVFPISPWCPKNPVVHHGLSQWKKPQFGGHAPSPETPEEDTAGICVPQKKTFRLLTYNAYIPIIFPMKHYSNIYIYIYLLTIATRNIPISINYILYLYNGIIVSTTNPFYHRNSQCLTRSPMRPAPRTHTWTFQASETMGKTWGKILKKMWFNHETGWFHGILSGYDGFLFFVDQQSWEDHGIYQCL